MNKININLHNLKTALNFSMEISRDYLSWYGLTYELNYNFFRRSAAKIRECGWNPCFFVSQPHGLTQISTGTDEISRVGDAKIVIFSLGAI